MPRRKRQIGTGLTEAGNTLGEIAELIQRNRQQRLDESALAHSQAMQEEHLGLAKDELRFRRSEATRRREAEEQAAYNATEPRRKARAYQHELGAELAGLTGSYAERAGPLAGKMMSKAFEEAGSIDQVNALMADMGSRINEMDKLSAYGEWFQEQEPDVQQYMTALRNEMPRQTAELVYLMERLLVKEGLKAEVKKKSQPPKMSEKEKKDRAAVEYWQKFFATAKGFEYVKAVTPWEGEISDEGKIEDPREVAIYKDYVKTLIKELVNLTDEEASKYIAKFMITPEDVGEVSVGEPEEFDIESILKSDEETED